MLSFSRSFIFKLTLSLTQLSDWKYISISTLRDKTMWLFMARQPWVLKKIEDPWIHWKMFHRKKFSNISPLLLNIFLCSYWILSGSSIYYRKAQYVDGKKFNFHFAYYQHLTRYVPFELLQNLINVIILVVIIIYITICICQAWFYSNYTFYNA